VTRVDFYLPPEGAASDRHTVTCRLTEKAYQLGHRVYIHTATQDEARQLDELLWTFRQGSFVPHGLLAATRDELTPVLIGAEADAGEEHDVLINLTDEVPVFFSRFKRVAEVVDGDAAARAAARSRYRYYRDRGYPLEIHELG
jgi:DNA polymerase-3 subunit chi